MATKLSFDDLPGENTKNFQGRDYGANVSFYLAVNEPGTGPPLHRHPYEETFIVQEGTVTFTVDGEEIEASAGEIVIVPAGAPHKFENSGEGMLRQVNLHPQDHMVQEDLE
jgi:quercetin dioxygenase-like cupin family protein